MEGIISKCSTLEGTYLRERNRNSRCLGAGLTIRNSHESIIVSMVIDAQPASSIDENLQCVFC